MPAGRPSQPGRLARSWFALACRAFPPAVRARFGDGLLETFADRWAERCGRGRLAAVWFLVAASVDVVRSGVLERVRVRRARAGIPRRTRRSSPMQTFGSDVRFALRGLRRSPFFAAVAVLTLAVGIGATTTIFSALEAVLLRPWPFPDARALVVPVTTHSATGARWSVNYGDYEDWRAAGVFESVAVYQRSSADMAAPGGDPERVQGVRTSEDFFRVLGVSAALGRLPSPEEYAPDADPVVVLSDGFWRSRFAADAGVLGRAIRLNGVAYTVIGVLPPEADALEASLATPLRPTAEVLEDYRDRDNFAFSSLARLADGRDLEATRAQLATVAARIEAEHRALREGTSADIVPLARWVAGDELSTVLWVALGAVGLVLLIGCANLANLLLARGVRRERELAVRGALGAGRARLVSQLLVESLVLALLGGAVGVLIAMVASRAVTANAPDLPRLDGAGVNLPVLVFALLLSLASAAIFGLPPAFRSTAVAGARALADRGVGGDGGVRGRRWRGALVVAEVALTVVLLAGAGLMLRSLARVMDVDPGFEPSGVLTFAVTLPSTRYEEIADVLAAHDRLRARIVAMPGVAAVAQASQLPLRAATGYLTRAYLPEGRPEPPLGAEVIGPWEIVTPGYFAAMGHAIRQGRDFAETDTDASPHIMIVNREFVRQMFGADTEPLGKRVRSWRDENVYREIVGVVDDVRYFGAGDEIRPVVYIPLPQDPRRGLNYVVRAEGDPASLVPALRAAVRDFDPDLATAAFTTMDDAFDASIAGRRFAASLLASFALIALLLAALGLYGVLSIAVAQRTREFGVRMALGAAARDVRWMVLREAGWLIGAGALAGILAAAAITRVLSAVLFDVSATDPATFAAALAVLLAIGMLASWLPAARATRVDPLRAIRAE